jgi:hypothetical protein
MKEKFNLYFFMNPYCVQNGNGNERYKKNSSERR